MIKTVCKQLCGIGDTDAFVKALRAHGFAFFSQRLGLGCLPRPCLYLLHMFLWESNVTNIKPYDMKLCAHDLFFHTHRQPVSNLHLLCVIDKYLQLYTVDLDLRLQDCYVLPKLSFSILCCNCCGSSKIWPCMFVLLTKTFSCQSVEKASHASTATRSMDQMNRCTPKLSSIIDIIPFSV